MDRDRARRHLAGASRPRAAVAGAVVALLAVASVAFLAGLPVALTEFTGWLLVVPGVAVAAGVLGAGLVPAVGSLWLVGLWGYVFPPLVGYLSGEWAPAGRYTHPRMMGFAYGSARAELVGALETSVGSGLVLAVVVGTVGYGVGAGLRWVATRLSSS
ncbi:hypothetical protein [Halobacterium yunchengense]|uniref:hypothetical protein n=1 Tax=Halobacterium yunchengense TaxID=3108497 RepID=UPI00300A1804